MILLVIVPLQGDWLEQKLNCYMCVSTMAAAGLGNTISDVFGIQTAVYVERFTEYLGFKAPPLTQFQFDMKCSKRAANLVSVVGRVVWLMGKVGHQMGVLWDKSWSLHDAR